jgi:hypothetical protein
MHDLLSLIVGRLNKTFIGEAERKTVGVGKRLGVAQKN